MNTGINTTQFMPCLAALFRIAAEDPSRIALIKNQTTVSYAALAREVRYFAYQLSQHIKGPDTLIIAQFSDDLNLIRTALASIMIGCPWTFFETRLADKLDLLPQYLFVHDLTFENGTNDKSVFAGTWISDLAKNAEWDAQIDLGPYQQDNRLAWLTSSSGTNAEPKFIGLSSIALVERAIIPREDFLSEIPITVCLFNPIAPVGMFSILTSLHWGGTHVRNYALDQIIKIKPDLIIGSANQIGFLISDSSKFKNEIRLPSVRLTGGSIPREFINHLLNFFERVQNVYGATETGRVATAWYTTQRQDLITVGKAFPNVTIEIVDDAHQPLLSPQEGNVRIKSNAMIRSYYFDEDETKLSFFDDWFYPGDMGFLREDGSLYITGRKRELLNIGGIKINPQHVDDIMTSIHGISDCVAFETSDERGAPQLAAVVVLNPQHKISEVIDRIFHNLKKFRAEFVPRIIYVAGKAPRNANGKASRRLAIEMSKNLKPINLYNIILDIISQIQKGNRLR